MGSSGKGSFGDYKKDERKCDDEVNCALEDIEKCEYFKKTKGVPKKDTKVSVRKKLVEGRLAVEEEETELVIGYLPTKYNHLHLCMDQMGYEYSGNVYASKLKPIPEVYVELIGVVP